MPKQRDSSAALRSKPESSTDEKKKKKKNVSSARLGDDQTWARLDHNRRNKRCVTLFAKIDPETPEGMPPEP